MNTTETMLFFDILEIIIKEIPIYKFKCNMSEEAVYMSYQTMSEKKEKNN